MVWSTTGTGLQSDWPIVVGFVDWVGVDTTAGDIIGVGSKCVCVPGVFERTCGLGCCTGKGKGRVDGVPILGSSTVTLFCPLPSCADVTSSCLLPYDVGI